MRYVVKAADGVPGDLGGGWWAGYVGHPSGIVFVSRIDDAEKFLWKDAVAVADKLAGHHESVKILAAK